LVKWVGRDSNPEPTP